MPEKCLFNKKYKLYYVKDNIIIYGPHDKLINTDNIYGDCSFIFGDAKNIYGTVTNLIGDVTGSSGDVTYNWRCYRY
ncbi:MAG: hypothetical protein AABY32_01585 [Nanoarchaeota archaeon]